MKRKLTAVISALLIILLISATAASCADIDEPANIQTDAPYTVPLSSESGTPVPGTSAAPAGSDEPDKTTAPSVTTTAPEETTTAPEPPKPAETRITFLATGDNIIHESVYTAAKTATGYDFLDIYSPIASLVSSADISFVNFESPIAGGTVSGYPAFNSPRESGDALISLGFDVINLANNHMLDKGASGLSSSIAYWNGTGATVIGGYTSQADYSNIRIVEKSGIKIAFLSYTYDTNNPLSSGASVVVPYFNDATVTAQIKAARNIADLVFVSAHWGTEYDTPAYYASFAPTTEQKRLASLMCEAGADLIIGTHPHVLETVTELTSASGHKTKVIYSLGNLLSNMRFDKTVLGGMSTVDIVKDSTGVRLENLFIHPLVCHYVSVDSGRTLNNDGYKIYPLSDYTDALAAVHGTNYRGNALQFSVSSLLTYYKNNIPLQYRPNYLK